MKTLFALALTFALCASAQAAPILEAVRNPGYEMHPQTRTVVVQDTGSVTLTVKDWRANKTITRDLGRLSAYAVKSLRDKIAAIDPNLPLVDPEEGQPMCTDTPSFHARAYINGQPKEISRSAGCHEWSLASCESRYLSRFVNAFLEF